LPERSVTLASPRGGEVSDLIACQRTVERMLTESRTLAEVEEYVEHCALDEMEKAGLWMLAWAHQDQATQLRLAKETLALVSSMRSPTKSGRKGAPPPRPPGKGGLPASGLIG
jgi:hypothetical protein